MAGSSLLALLDDIATILDDVALMTKVATKKTAGVLGDDLALNAQQVSGVAAQREIPVVWAVAKGSFKNKLILVPSALAISAFLPSAITPLLMLGGAFLCFEGVEKLSHKFLHSKEEDEKEKAKLLEVAHNPEADMVDFEKDKIKGAIRTDFILSAEIITISLGTVANAAFSLQVAVLSTIAIIMTVGVYGLVAGIAKLDDLGLHLLAKTGTNLVSKFNRQTGRAILLFAPYLMKSLSIFGTAAMFLVGGGILVHGIPWIEIISHSWALSLAEVPSIGGVLEALTPSLVSMVVGLVAGGLVLLGFLTGKKIYGVVFSKAA